MRKIDMTRYPLPWRSDLPEAERVFDVCASLAAVVFNNREMTPRELLKVNALAEKIERSQGYVLLEDAEYDKLIAGLEGTSPAQLTRDAAECVRRVLDAPQIEVVPREKEA